MPEKEATSKTCLSIVEEKEEKTSGRRNTMVKDTIVKDTMVKGVEGGSVTTLLLGGNDEKKGHETGK